MWWTLFIIFLLTSIFSLTALFYALRRINQYENLLIEFQKIVSFSTERMKLVDENGTFESDDEVGFFFTEIKQLGRDLENLFETEVEDAPIKEKKKKEK